MFSSIKSLLTTISGGRKPVNPFHRAARDDDQVVNLYCSVGVLSPLNFSHHLNAERQLSDKDLRPHLNGFIGYVLARGDGAMTRERYHIMRHLQKTQHHISISIAHSEMEQLAVWASENNALLFMPDGAVCDPMGKSLIDAEGNAPDPAANIPFHLLARQRKQRSEMQLQERKLKAMDSLPPVISEAEVRLRSAKDVVGRLHAILAVSIYAEARRSGNDLPIFELRKRMPLGVSSLSTRERAFLELAEPDEKDIIAFGWRYECAQVLAWAIGLLDTLPFPQDICDVQALVKLVLDAKDLEKSGKLRSDVEILDALDLHYRLNWILRQARRNGVALPEKVEPGVVQERHFALNWLTHFEDADWDDVDTPT